MDALTISILSSAAYEILKTGVKFTTNSIKEILKNWILDDISAGTLAIELENLGLSDELSEKAIQRKIEQSHKITDLLQTMQSSPQIINITQNHSGTGDNVGRDKNC
jgi:6-phosphogluconate dehydrogenase